MFALPYNINDKLPGWYAVMGLCAVLAIIFLFRAARAKKRESPPTVVTINRGFALFFLAFMITRVLFAYSDYERLNHVDETDLYATYVLFGYLSSLLGISVLAYLTDTYMLETKRHIFTKVAIAVTIANTGFIILWVTTQLIPLNVPRFMIYGSTTLVFVMILLIYGGLARQSTGKLRRNAIISLFGILIAVLGILLDMQFIAQSAVIPIYIPPIVTFIGLLFFALGQHEV